MITDQKPVNYEFVDSLRGYAIILVLIGHNYLGFPMDNGNYPDRFGAIVYQAVYGVQLFYIVSAFTLFLSLSRTGTKRNWIKNFSVRRFFRIAPLFYLAIFAYSLRSYFRNEYIDIVQIICSATFVNSFFPNMINGIFHGSWSIAIEMIFYLLVPLLFILIKDVNRSIIVFSISVILAKVLGIMISVSLGNQLEEIGPYLYFYLPAQLPVFSLGIVLFFLTEKVGKKISAASIALLSLTLIVHCVLGGKGIIQNFVLLSVGFVGMAYCFSIMKQTWLVNRFVSLVGRVSFGIYLFHWIIFDLVVFLKLDHLLSNPVANFLLRLVFELLFSVAISYCLHITIEKPMQKWGKKFVISN